MKSLLHSFLKYKKFSVFLFFAPFFLFCLHWLSFRCLIKFGNKFKLSIFAKLPEITLEVILTTFVIFLPFDKLTYNINKKVVSNIGLEGRGYEKQFPYRKKFVWSCFSLLKGRRHNFLKLDNNLRSSGSKPMYLWKESKEEDESGRYQLRKGCHFVKLI